MGWDEIFAAKSGEPMVLSAAKEGLWVASVNSLGQASRAMWPALRVF